MNSIENILKISMEHLRNLADANTIIGTPLSMPDGSTVIPVSKVGMGILSGGSDIPTKTPIRTSAEAIAEYPFGGTAAAGVGLTPVSFIVINQDGVKVMPVEYKSAADRFIDSLVPLLESVATNMKKNNCD